MGSGAVEIVMGSVPEWARYGSGDGYGYGSGSGYGDGYGYGYGYGYGSGYPEQEIGGARCAVATAFAREPRTVAFGFATALELEGVA